MKVRLVSVAFLAWLLAACAAGPGAGGSGGSAGGGSGTPGGTVPGAGAIQHPAGPSDLVLRVSTDGGLVAPGVILTHIPEFSLYGDGRVITVGPQIAIYPGPALPNLLLQRVSQAGVQRILEAARTAGLLGADRQIDFPGIMDAPTTTLTVVAGGSTHVTRVYALGIDGGTAAPGGAGGSSVGRSGAGGPGAADAAARRAISGFRARLDDLGAWLGRGVVEPEQAYAFDAIRLFIDRADLQSGGPTSQPGEVRPSFVTWPGIQPLGSLGTPVAGLPDTRCAVLQGPELARVLPALRGSNTLTRWLSGGTFQPLAWALRLRPLLPEESGCAGSSSPG